MFFRLRRARGHVGADTDMVDPDGVDLLADGEPLRLPFEVRADTADAVRQRLIALLQQTRAAVGTA